MSILKSIKNQLREAGVTEKSVVVISSDVRRLIRKLMDEDRKEHRKRKPIDAYLDEIIEMFQQMVGKEGTLLFHTFFWSFCHGEAFDYDYTPGETGILSNHALKRKDFFRTKHPIYSFAVWGKDKEYLVGMENTDAFAEDSPFAYMLQKKAIYVSIDVDAWSYFHYIEQSNHVEYRFVKKFTAPYIKDGVEKLKTYSMFVRYLCLNVEQLRFWEDFLDEKSKSELLVEGIPIHVIYCEPSYRQISDDIMHNGARNLVTYDREMASKHLQTED